MIEKGVLKDARKLKTRKLKDLRYVNFFSLEVLDLFKLLKSHYVLNSTDMRP